MSTISAMTGNTITNRAAFANTANTTNAQGLLASQPRPRILAEATGASSRTDISTMSVSTRSAPRSDTMRAANDAVSIAQTAQSALSGTSANLQRMRELAVMSSSADIQNSDRQANITAEADVLKNDVTRLATQTEFKGQKLLDGSFRQDFQVGDTKQTLAIDKADTAALDVAGIDLSTREGAQSAIAQIDKALASIGEQQQNLGDFQNRIGSAVASETTKQINLAKEHIKAAVDISDRQSAENFAADTRLSVLMNAGTAMLAQANQSGQQVMSLLR